AGVRGAVSRPGLRSVSVAPPGRVSARGLIGGGGGWIFAAAVIAGVFGKGTLTVCGAARRVTGATPRVTSCDSTLVRSFVAKRNSWVYFFTSASCALGTDCKRTCFDSNLFSGAVARTKFVMLTLLMVVRLLTVMFWIMVFCSIIVRGGRGI